MKRCKMVYKNTDERLAIKILSGAGKAKSKKMEG